MIPSEVSIANKQSCVPTCCSSLLSDRLVVPVSDLREGLTAAQETGEQEVMKVQSVAAYPAVHVSVRLGNHEPLGVATLS